MTTDHATRMREIEGRLRHAAIVGSAGADNDGYSTGLITIKEANDAADAMDYLLTALADAEKRIDALLEMGTKAADGIARIGEFHTCGAWLWSNLDKERPEFAEAEWRRKHAEEIKDEMWAVMNPMIPDDEDKAP